MQALRWYLRRLQGMSLGEITWRGRSMLRDTADRYRFALGFYPSLKAALAIDGNVQGEPGFRVSDLCVGDWASGTLDGMEATWFKELLYRADRICQNRFSFLGLQDRVLSNPIDWNRDYGSGKATPRRFSQSIDYRDQRVAGDAKLVWELNRHHHLVVLGRAYRASGDLRYAAAAVKQIESWLQQCPFGMGMNWRSPLELAIRLINWIWTIDLTRESGLYSGTLRSRLLHAVYLHLWEITRKYSRGSSANNHLIGEAAGVFIATSYFPQLANAARWREESYNILSQEITRQTYPDGGGREQALGYHLFVLQFFLFAGIAARRTGQDFPPPYWSRLEKMLEFVGALSEGGNSPPMFGDYDDGYVLDLGSPPGDTRALLSVGAAIFRRSDFKMWAGGYAEPARWLLGRTGRDQFRAISPTLEGERLLSRAFPDSGYYLLQCGHRESADRVSVVFDCGNLGFDSIAAHGHADCLSFTLRAFGADVFVDPGTYDYFSFPAWRDYFRSTRAHNTVLVDGADQSIMLGPFLWGSKAQARCIAWEPRVQGGKAIGQHDGYTQLVDPVVHRRTLDLDQQSRILRIHDEIVARGPHEVTVYFHLSEDCVVSLVRSNRYEIAVAGGMVALEVDPRLSVRTLQGSEEPRGGWVSRGYHRKVPCTTVMARGSCQGPASFMCRVEINPARYIDGEATGCHCAPAKEKPMKISP